MHAPQSRPPDRAQLEQLFRQKFDAMQPVEVLDLVRGCEDVGVVKLLQALDLERLVGRPDAELQELRAAGKPLLAGKLGLLRCLERPDWLRLERLCVVVHCDCAVELAPCLCAMLRTFVRVMGRFADLTEARGYCGQPVSLRQLRRAEKQVEADPEALQTWECDCPARPKPCPHAAEPACPLPTDAEAMLLALLHPVDGKGKPLYAEPPRDPRPAVAVSKAAQTDVMTRREKEGYHVENAEDLAARRAQDRARLGIAVDRPDNGAKGIGNQLKRA